MDRILQFNNKSCLQIAGPTASGKSALAIKLAQIHDGEIINADSMQVYNILNVLTARPSQNDLGTIPHHLYGHIAPGSDYSTGHWIEEVKPVLDDIKRRGKTAIFVGGTGLYFKALNGGLSDIPPIAQPIRDKWREMQEKEGIMTLYQELSKLDLPVAMELKPTDKQRIIRALEVFDATGKSIRYFHKKHGKAVVCEQDTGKIVLLPNRSILHKTIEMRFHKMVSMGAVEEVKKLLAIKTDPSHTSMKAIGVPQISRYIKKEIDLDQAIDLSIIATRQYAKRQSTWFRNQLGANWHIATSSHYDEII